MVECLGVDIRVGSQEIFDHIITTLQASPMKGSAPLVVLGVTSKKALADQVMRGFDIIWLGCKVQTIHAIFQTAGYICARADQQ